MKVSIAFLFLISSVYVAASGPSWDYTSGPQGADWGTIVDGEGDLEWPLCNGDRQSPIDIVREKTILYEGDDMLGFSFNYCDGISGYFQSNGHTIQFYPDCDGGMDHDDPLTATYITGGPLGDVKYHFWQFHFHWGSSDTDGSENTVDGVQNAAEVHFVHVKEDYINPFNAAAALADPEGLAVLAIFIEGEAPDTADTAWFDPIATAAEAIEEAVANGSGEGDGYDTKIPSSTGFNLNQMVQKINPSFKADFNYWHFEGSLTTPGCNEAAHFIVSERALAITDDQMATFFNLVDSSGGALLNTYREVQDDNCRKVSYVHKNTETEYTYTSPHESG